MEKALGCSDERCWHVQASPDLPLSTCPVPHNHSRPPAQIRLHLPCRFRALSQEHLWALGPSDLKTSRRHVQLPAQVASSPKPRPKANTLSCYQNSSLAFQRTGGLCGTWPGVGSARVHACTHTHTHPLQISQASALPVPPPLLPLCSRPLALCQTPTPSTVSPLLPLIWFWGAGQQ